MSLARKLGALFAATGIIDAVHGGTPAGAGVDGATLGASGGAQTHTLATA